MYIRAQLFHHTGVKHPQCLFFPLHKRPGLQHYINGKSNYILHSLITMLAYSRQKDKLDVQSFSGADCDTDHCLVVAKVRERLAVSK